MITLYFFNYYDYLNFDNSNYICYNRIITYIDLILKKINYQNILDSIKFGISTV